MLGLFFVGARKAVSKTNCFCFIVYSENGHLLIIILNVNVMQMNSSSSTTKYIYKNAMSKTSSSNNSKAKHPKWLPSWSNKCHPY